MFYDMLYGYDAAYYYHVLFHDPNDFVDLVNCYPCKEDFAYMWLPQWIEELNELFE